MATVKRSSTLFQYNYHFIVSSHQKTKGCQNYLLEVVFPLSDPQNLNNNIFMLNLIQLTKNNFNSSTDVSRLAKM